MPQLDTSTFASQILWLLIFFSIILLFTAKITLPRLDKKLHTRWQLLDDAQQETLKLQQSIADLTDKSTHDFNQAKTESQLLIAQTVANINKQHAQQVQVIKSQFKQQFDEFEARMVLKKLELSAGISTMAVKAVDEIMQHLIQRSVPHELVNTAVNQVSEQGRSDD